MIIKFKCSYIPLLFLYVHFGETRLIRNNNRFIFLLIAQKNIVNFGGF